MKAKKVKVEVVGIEPKKSKFEGFLEALKKVFFRLKLGLAIILDGVDFLIAWIPIINTLWDVVCFLILLVILKNKKLAFINLVELPFIGLLPLSFIDMILPMNTIIVLLDNSELGNVFVQRIK